MNTEPALILRFTKNLNKAGVPMLTVWDEANRVLSIDTDLHASMEHLDQHMVQRTYRDVAAGEDFRD